MSAEYAGYPSAVRSAIQREELVTTGKVLGLTEEETVETLHLWQQWSSETGTTLSLMRLRSVLAARAAGEDWRPPT